jgi:hypothetical protein
MLGRRFSFWLAVAGVSVLAQFGVELAARKVPIPGLRRFADFIHCDNGGS